MPLTYEVWDVDVGISMPSKKPTSCHAPPDRGTTHFSTLLATLPPQDRLFISAFAIYPYQQKVIFSAIFIFLNVCKVDDRLQRGWGAELDSGDCNVMTLQGLQMSVPSSPALDWKESVHSE